MSEFWGEPISVYPQEQAIEDGVLVRDPIATLAKEAGFRQPVTFSAALYAACEKAHGDLDAWLWDVLQLGRRAWAPVQSSAEAGQRSIGPIAYKLKIGTRVRTVWLSWNSFEAFTFMFPEDN